MKSNVCGNGPGPCGAGLEVLDGIGGVPPGFVGAAFVFLAAVEALRVAFFVTAGGLDGDAELPAFWRATALGPPGAPAPFCWWAAASAGALGRGVVVLGAGTRPDAVPSAGFEAERVTLPEEVSGRSNAWGDDLVPDIGDTSIEAVSEAAAEAARG